MAFRLGEDFASLDLEIRTRSYWASAQKDRHVETCLNQLALISENTSTSSSILVSSVVGSSSCHFLKHFFVDIFSFSIYLGFLLFHYLLEIDLDQFTDIFLKEPTRVTPHFLAPQCWQIQNPFPLEGVYKTIPDRERCLSWS